MAEVKNQNDTSNIAQRYANALFELAKEQGNFDDYKNDLALVSDIFSSSRDLEQFIAHPVVPQDEKKAVIEEIFAKHVSANVINFLKLLIDKNRLMYLHSIKNVFNDLYRKHCNVMVAEVISAIELSDENKQRIVQKLENIYNKSIELHSYVDSSIIAGLILKIDDKTIDGSVKSQIETMKKQII